MPLGNLIREERSIYVFKKTKSKYRGQEIDKIDIDSISFDVVKNIVTPNDGDPFLFDPYPLSPDELDKLNKFIEPKIKPDHKKFDYVMETYGIYDKL
jgi:hypothetical protein